MGDWLSSAWDWFKVNREALVSSGTFIAGVVIAIAALRQANIAARRHNAQTDADRQRRITESYAKATEQLGSDKIEVRLGGIYTLERISKESPDDYWTVMETLTAFVRVRAPVKEADEISEADPYLPSPGPATDIAAILSILRRRDAVSQRREVEKKWSLDLHGAALAFADLTSANLSRANLLGADLSSAALLDTDLTRAQLPLADLTGARLTAANLTHANLLGTKLTGADMRIANLLGADLTNVDLTDADLTDAKINQAQLDQAYGENARLPPGMTLKPCPHPAPTLP
jgi:hypothetical protein